MTALDIDTEGRGHPPSAHGLLMIDFDATIVPWGEQLMENRTAFPGVRNAINQLRAEGFTIIIFTSRLSPAWCSAAGQTVQAQRAYVATQLMRNGIEFDQITAEKLPAEAYFDDKAYRVTPGDLASALAMWRNGRP